MGHRVGKSILSFLLVLVLTIFAVSTLSTVTKARAESPSQAYSRVVREAAAQAAEEEITELSAAAPKEEHTSILLSSFAFLMILAIPAGGVLLFLRARKTGKEVQKPAGRRYSPRSDMAFRV